MISKENFCIGKIVMYKWSGCILILVACSGIGFSASSELQGHLYELEELKKIFCLLKSELHYTRAPFSEVFEKIGNKAISPYREWLMMLSQRINSKTGSTFYEIWCVSIANDLKKSRLKVDELDELKSAGKSLEYLDSLDGYLEQLEYKIKNTREAYQSKRKLCQSMGVMGGIFLLILFL